MKLHTTITNQQKDAILLCVLAAVSDTDSLPDLTLAQVLIVTLHHSTAQHGAA